MGPVSDLFGILLLVVVILFIRGVIRVAAAASNGADGPNAVDTPAQSVAKADARPVSPIDKARARMATQRDISARKAELQAKRESKKAAQTISLSEGQAKSRRQAASLQPERATESSSFDRNEWMNGFDIRRAVVWSEILRPKFQEDEVSDRFGIPY